MSTAGSFPEAVPVPATGLGWCVLVLFGIFTCGGLWSVIQIVTQWLLNRPTRKAEIARVHAEIEEKETTTDVTRQKILAESQIALQQAALDADTKTIARLNDELDECQQRCERRKNDFDGLRELTTAIVDAFSDLLTKMRSAADAGSGVIVMKVSAQEFLSWRSVINAARERLP